MKTAAVASVLSFWFSSKPNYPLWFGKSQANDEFISSQFLGIHRAVTSTKSPIDGDRSKDGLLASIILLDQFSRNMFRGMAVIPLIYIMIFVFDAIVRCLDF
jgi:uncharacterized protein (DUF924 family)